MSLAEQSLQRIRHLNRCRVECDQGRMPKEVLQAEEREFRKWDPYRRALIEKERRH